MEYELLFDLFYYVIVAIIFVIFIIGISTVRDDVGVAHITVFILLSVLNIITTSFITKYERGVNVILFSLKLIFVLPLIFLIYNIITIVPENILFFIPMFLYLTYQLIYTLFGLVIYS